MREPRHDLSLATIRQGLNASRLPEHLKDLAHQRLDLAAAYIDDNARLGDVIRPGRLVIVGVYPRWGSDGIAAEMRYAFGVIRHVLQKRRLPDAMPDGQHSTGCASRATYAPCARRSTHAHQQDR